MSACNWLLFFGGLMLHPGADTLCDIGRLCNLQVTWNYKERVRTYNSAGQIFYALVSVPSYTLRIWRREFFFFLTNIYLQIILSLIRYRLLSPFQIFSHLFSNYFKSNKIASTFTFSNYFNLYILFIYIIYYLLYSNINF